MTQALTDAEFDRLDEFLMSEEAPQNSMDSSMLDGYLAAIASGPNLVMPDEMLRWAWDTEYGEEEPAFSSPEHAQEIIGLILRHYQTVNDALNDQAYEPRILERAHKGRLIPIIDEWCIGYHTAIKADLAAWRPLMDTRSELLAVVQLYGTPEGWAKLEKKRLTDAQHQAAADSLEVSARSIHAYWLDQRRRGLNRGETPGIMAARRSVAAPAMNTPVIQKPWLH